MDAKKTLQSGLTSAAIKAAVPKALEQANGFGIAKELE